MKYISRIIKTGLTLSISAMMLISCNKDLEQFTEPVIPPPTAAGQTLAQTIAATPGDSLYYRMIVRAGLVPTISNTSAYYTMFVPDNNAVKLLVNALSGGAIPLAAPDAVFSDFIANTLPAANATAIVSYNIIPQAVRTTDIPATFPNYQYPTIFNPAPSLSALLRLDIFPGTLNGAWVNNIPLTAVNIETGNGIIHNEAFVTTPPQRYLWDRIDTDPQLTFLRAAILRADSGIVPNPAAPNTLQLALQSIGANLTVFAPTDAAFQMTLTGAIYQALVTQGVPPATALMQATALAASPTVFSNPALYSVLTAQTVKGIIVYHIFGTRAFTNNFPTTPTLIKTLLNTAIPTHPGVTLTATFGVPFVTSATIQGAYNATAANIIINASPLIPDPSGTSDQHYTNGVLHEIDQVLIPLPL